jgi:DNA-binding GntR family transcriptional regulator
MNDNNQQRSATLAEIVADMLKQSLQNGVYTCGERLVEMTIASELNVSQNTVREALRIMEHDGWVVKRARHGIYVRSFTSKQAEELYTLRIALEQLIMDWALMNISEDDKIYLARVVADARIFAGMGNDLGIRETLLIFHETLLGIANRPLATKILKTMFNQSRLLGNLRAIHDPISNESYIDSLTRYGKLLTEIRYQDHDAAQATLYEILHAECKPLLPLLDLLGHKQAT